MECQRCIFCFPLGFTLHIPQKANCIIRIAVNVFGERICRFLSWPVAHFFELENWLLQWTVDIQVFLLFVPIGSFFDCLEIHLPRLIARLPKTGQVFSSVEHGVIGEAGLHVQAKLPLCWIAASHPFPQVFPFLNSWLLPMVQAGHLGPGSRALYWRLQVQQQWLLL